METAIPFDLLSGDDAEELALLIAASNKCPQCPATTMVAKDLKVGEHQAELTQAASAPPEYVQRLEAALQDERQNLVDSNSSCKRRRDFEITDANTDSPEKELVERLCAGGDNGLRNNGKVKVDDLIRSDWKRWLTCVKKRERERGSCVKKRERGERRET
ncbi:5-tetrahydropyridine-2,6-dicarboxylate N-succinyltransferase [Striga asiatica]|uniref:5-tetrahydropyridine-2,6-dicarboxylate N-succinyltransferase n=1 Tax=Striga asiatica TaxID=4170 RepID=A0A5A7RB51_STRAF|nr:5-tetrahydropyridine-2,6-dicarboxylate N-succinyltransferase [Striga asiatica]